MRSAPVEMETVKNDLRLTWFKDVITTSLSIEPSVVDQFLERCDGKNQQQLLEIMESHGEDLIGRALIFYYLLEEEEIEIEQEPSSSEETLSEEEEELSTEESESESEEEIETGTPVSSYEEDLASTYIDYTISSELSPSEMSSSESLKEASVTVKVEEPDQFHKKKIIKQVITQTVLYMSYCKIPYIAACQDLVYFLKINGDRIPFLTTWEDVLKMLPVHFEIGFLSSFSIRTLQDILKKVYLPYFKSDAWNKSCALSVDELNELISEVASQIQMFVDSIDATSTSAGDKTSLVIPTSLLSRLEVGTGPDDAREFEDLIASWNESLTTVITNQISMKIFKAHNFSGIVQKWKENYSCLGYLVQSLQSENVQKVIKIFTTEGNFKLAAFLDHADEIQKHFSIAEQNVEMLSLLQRQLTDVNALIETDDAAAAVKIFPDIMHNLKLLWTVSNYYSSEQSMLVLLEKITEGLSELACKDIEIQNLTQNSSEVAERIESAVFILREWRNTYNREMDNGNQQCQTLNWTCDPQEVFKCAHYRQSILEEMLRIIQECEKLVKSGVTSNEILSDDTCNTVQNKVLKHFSEATFDVFDPVCKKEWERTLENVLKELKSLEGQQTNESLVREPLPFFVSHQLKYCTFPAAGNSGTFFKQHLEHLSHLEDRILKEGNYRPPVYKNLSPVTSKVLSHFCMWKSLTDEVALLEQSGCNTDKDVKEVMIKSLEIANRLQSSMKQEVQSWQAQAEVTTQELLKCNLLKSENNRAIETSLSESKLPKEQKINTSNIEVNYPAELKIILNEYKYFHHLQLINSSILQKSLFLEEHYNRCSSSLKSILGFIENVKEEFPESQAILGDSIFQGFDSLMVYGCEHFSWNSYGIEDYIKQCQQGVSSQVPLFSRLQKATFDLERHFEKIASVNFLQHHGNDCPQNKLWTENQYHACIAELKVHHKLLTAELTRTEQLFYTNTTKDASPLRKHFTSLDDKIADSFAKMIAANIKRIRNVLTEEKTKFSTEVILQEKSITFSPSLDEIFANLCNHLEELINSVQYFFEMKHESEEDRNSKASRLRYKIHRNETLNQMCVELKQFFWDNLRGAYECWAPLWKYKYLWAVSPQEKVQELQKSETTALVYDTNLNFFKRTKTEVTEAVLRCSGKHSILRIASHSLLASLLDIINEWTRALSEDSIANIESTLHSIQENMKKFDAELNQMSETSEEVDLHLAIGKLEKILPYYETTLNDIEEKLQILAVHNIKFSEDLPKQVDKVNKWWHCIVFQLQQLKECQI